MCSDSKDIGPSSAIYIYTITALSTRPKRQTTFRYGPAQVPKGRDVAADAGTTHKCSHDRALADVESRPNKTARAEMARMEYLREDADGLLHQQTKAK